MSLVKMTVTLSLLPEIWQAFQAACLARKVYPSHEVQRLMARQLKNWQAATAADQRTQARPRRGRTCLMKTLARPSCSSR